MRLIDADKLGLTDFEIILCDGDYKEVLKQILCKIENAPTIDDEPVKHGTWIGKPMIGGYSRIRCSVCDNVFLENKEKWNYCPNCGARMVNDV